MIKKIWNSYIEWLLNYLDTDNGVNHWKFALIEMLHMLFMFLIWLIIFYFLVGVENILGIFAISIGCGRILFDQILKKYDKNHPYDKRYTPFLRFLSYSAILFVTIGGTFVLIKDARENNTDVQRFIEKNYSDVKVEDSSSETNSSNNIYNFNDKLQLKIQLENE